MNISEVKAGIQTSIGSHLTRTPDGEVKMTADFGRFVCSVENFDNFTILRRNFETSGESVDIPFTCIEPSVQMIFSLEGQSVFNDRYNPFLLSRVSHCINYFKNYECRNLLADHSHQQDITFRLKKSFYTELIANHLSSSEDRLPSMIFNQKEFNTINQHIPMDAGIFGILRNIQDCPYTGSMRNAFIREHVRALLMLQLFHFNPIVTGENIRSDRRISRRDEDTLHEVKKYIDERFLDPSSLERISRHFGINEFKLKHGFKVVFDTSPMRYLQYKRLEFSRVLLRDTDKTIREIAGEIGYSHAANFTIAFTKMFGKSPQHSRAKGSNGVTRLY